MKVKQTRTIENLKVRADFVPTTINDSDRTIDVTFATETPVRMFSWEEGAAIYEILSFEKDHVRLERLNSGAPVLDNHDRYKGVRGVLGVVTNARVENGVGVATLKFSNREDVASVWQDVKEGMLRGVSVGYNVYAYEVSKKEGELSKYRAVDWEPYEISFAPVQADINSAVRSHEVQKNEVLITRESITTKVNKMIYEEKQDLEAEAKKSKEVANQKREAELKIEGRSEEKARSMAINEIVRKANLPETFAKKWIDEDVTVESARSLALDALEAETNKGVQSANRVSVGEDESQKEREAKIASMLMRSGSIDQSSLSEKEKSLASNYRGLTLMDMAKQSLKNAGLSDKEIERMDKMEIAGRSISSSTSDFPVLLEGTSRRVLLASYNSVADTWRKFSKVGSVSDFREFKRLRWGSLTRLDALGENSEYKNKKINDAESEKIKATTFGNTINVSRQMIVNDDLQGFTDLARMLGRASARGIEIDVYSLLAMNGGLGPNMSDGNPLFHVSHKNLMTTGAAPSVAQFDAMRVMMSQQTDKDNNDFLDVRPYLSLAPIGMDSAIKVINSSEYDPDALNKLQKPNAVRGMFSETVGTPRLSGTAYYAFANPADEPVIEVAFLDGKQTPYLESENPFDIDGVRWKARLDYGVGAIGFRGVVRNPGA